MKKLFEDLPQNAKVLDYGCFGWKLKNIIVSGGQYHGCDIDLPLGKPKDAFFHAVDPIARVIPVEDDFFDLIIASHVFEHISDPISLFQELGRVCKPGGKIYIETPSDRSLLVKSHKRAESHSFYSFGDDPTHIRPYTPAALYRLAVFHGFNPVDANYITSFRDKLLFPIKWLFYSITRNCHALTEATWLAKSWSCSAIIEKPKEIIGKPTYKYLSLKNVPAGISEALAARELHQGSR